MSHIDIMYTGTETKMKFRYAPSLFQRQERAEVFGANGTVMPKDPGPKVQNRGNWGHSSPQFIQWLKCGFVCPLGKGRRVEELNNCR